MPVAIIGQFAGTAGSFGCLPLLGPLAVAPLLVAALPADAVVAAAPLPAALTVCTALPIIPAAPLGIAAPEIGKAPAGALLPAFGAELVFTGAVIRPVLAVLPEAPVMRMVLLLLLFAEAGSVIGVAGLDCPAPLSPFPVEHEAAISVASTKLMDQGDCSGIRRMPTSNLLRWNS